MKLKSLPSQRTKKRYIVFRVHSQAPVQYPQLKGAILESLLEFLGEDDFSRASPRLIRNLWNGREGFLVTDPKHVDKAKLALSLVHQVAEERVIIQTLKVSGTIKSGKKALSSKKPNRNARA